MKHPTNISLIILKGYAKKIRDKTIEWSKKEYKVIVSNADTEYIEGLYKDSVFTIIKIKAPRYISGKNDGWGARITNL